MHTETTAIEATRFRPGTNASPIARIRRVGTDRRPELTLAKAA